MSVELRVESFFKKTYKTLPERPEYFVLLSVLSS